MSSQSEIQKIEAEALKAFESAKDLKELYDHKVQFLGKTGSFSKIMQGMKNLPAEERPLFGQKVNEAKKSLEEAYVKGTAYLFICKIKLINSFFIIFSFLLLDAG